MGLFVFVLLFIGIFDKRFFMPLVENFSATQYVATPNLLVLDDTSTGSDAGITVRYVYLQKADGSYLVEEGTTTDYEVGFAAPKNVVFATSNSGSLSAQVTALTAQVTALQAQLAALQIIKDRKVSKLKYNRLARKWNAAFPSNKVWVKP
jgi:hypothetical protein